MAAFFRILMVAALAVMVAGCGTLQFSVDKEMCAVFEFRIMDQPNQKIVKEFCGHDLQQQIHDFMMSKEGAVYQIFVMGVCQAFDCAKLIQDLVDGTKKSPGEAVIDDKTKRLLTE